MCLKTERFSCNSHNIEFTDTLNYFLKKLLLSASGVHQRKVSVIMGKDIKMHLPFPITYLLYEVKFFLHPLPAKQDVATNMKT
jgi:hypothetical protein